MSRFYRHSVRLACVFAVCGGLSAPADAGGFFEDLFQGLGLDGGAAVHRQADAMARAREARRQRESQRQRAARIAERWLKDRERDATPVVNLAEALARRPRPCCMTASQALGVLVQDETLRPGDAYASTEGLRVFVGSAEGAHRPADFVPLAEARNISAGMRARLAAESPPDAHRAASASKAPGEASTPSLLIRASRPQASDPVVVDAEGKAIRFVGGALPTR